jgi:hypothetical protein
MGHQWQDVGRGILFRTRNVNITEPYREALGVKEKLNGMAAYCDGDGCEIAPCGTYMIHKTGCAAMYNPRTDGGTGMQDEECG